MKIVLLVTVIILFFWTAGFLSKHIEKAESEGNLSWLLLLVYCMVVLTLLSLLLFLEIFTL
mgnify:CR=1 FL=1